MHVLILFMVGAFLAGGARFASPIRRWRLVALSLTMLVAASFYSLSVVM